MRIGLFGVFAVTITTLMWFAGAAVADFCNNLAAAGSSLAVPLFIGTAAVGAFACLAATWAFVRVLPD